jgi:hypothetical protein
MRMMTMVSGMRGDLPSVRELREGTRPAGSMVMIRRMSDAMSYGHPSSPMMVVVVVVQLVASTT